MDVGLLELCDIPEGANTLYVCPHEPNFTFQKIGEALLVARQARFEYDANGT